MCGAFPICQVNRPISWLQFLFFHFAAVSQFPNHEIASRTYLFSLPMNATHLEAIRIMLDKIVPKFLPLALHFHVFMRYIPSTNIAAVHWAFTKINYSWIHSRINRAHNTLISSGCDGRACGSLEFAGFHPSRERNISTIVTKTVYGTLKRFLNFIASGCDGTCMLGFVKIWWPNTDSHASSLRYTLQSRFALPEPASGSCLFLLRERNQRVISWKCHSIHMSVSAKMSPIDKS